jgi:hypothetical protein
MASLSHFFDINEQRLEGVCKLCRDAGKQSIVKFSSSAKSNFKSHFKTHHKDVSVEAKANALKIETIQQHFCPQPFARQEELTTSLVDLIIDSNLPINIVERPSFRKVLAVASSSTYKNVTTRSFREKIIEKRE